MNEMKTCSCCKIEKSVSEFGLYPSKKLKSRCKSCCTKATQLWRTDNKLVVDSYRESYYIECDPATAITRRFKYFVSSCKRRNGDTELSIEMLQDIFNRQTGRCKYTDLPLTAEANKINTMSIDRIDNTKGYVFNNVQFICHVANIMKNKHTEEQFIHLCHLVAQNNKRPDNPVELAVN